jgi:hypothetical protein
MKIICEKRNTGCYIPPHLKGISSRDLWRRGHKKMMKDTLVVEIRGYWIAEWSKLLGLPGSFSFRVHAAWPLVESDCAPWLRLCCASSFDLGSTTRAEARKGNEPSHISWLRRHPLSGKNFQAESNIGAFEDDLLWDIRTGWIYEHTVEIMTTRLENGPMPCRVLTQNKWYTSTNRVKL